MFPSSKTLFTDPTMLPLKSQETWDPYRQGRTNSTLMGVVQKNPPLKIQCRSGLVTPFSCQIKKFRQVKGVVYEKSK